MTSKGRLTGCATQSEAYQWRKLAMDKMSEGCDRPPLKTTDPDLMSWTASSADPQTFVFLGEERSVAIRRTKRGAHSRVAESWCLL